MWLGLGAAAALLAILLDAYAEHVLRSRLAAEILAPLGQATRYQMMHAVALVAVRIRTSSNGRWLNAACGCWVLGMLLFGGGIWAAHLLAMDAARPFVPVGGLAYMAGWLSLAIAAWRGE